MAGSPARQAHGSEVIDLRRSGDESRTHLEGFHADRAPRAEREAAREAADEEHGQHYSDYRNDLGIGRSLANSARRIKAVLDERCPTCGTEPGAYCWSRTRGFHLDRWRSSLALSVDELGEVVTEEFGGQP